MENSRNRAIRDIVLIFLVAGIGILLSIGILSLKDFVFSKKGVYVYGTLIGLTSEQTDKIIDGVKRRANDPNWK